jgi:hypothetical protein
MLWRIQFPRGDYLPKGTFATITHMPETLMPKNHGEFYYETNL